MSDRLKAVPTEAEFKDRIKGHLEVIERDQPDISYDQMWGDDSVHFDSATFLDRLDDTAMTSTLRRFLGAGQQGRSLSIRIHEGEPKVIDFGGGFIIPQMSLVFDRGVLSSLEVEDIGFGSQRTNRFGQNQRQRTLALSEKILGALAEDLSEGRARWRQGWVDKASQYASKIGKGIYAGLETWPEAMVRSIRETGYTGQIYGEMLDLEGDGQNVGLLINGQPDESFVRRLHHGTLGSYLIQYVRESRGDRYSQSSVTIKGDSWRKIPDIAIKRAATKEGYDIDHNALELDFAASMEGAKDRFSHYAAEFMSGAVLLDAGNGFSPLREAITLLKK